MRETKKFVRENRGPEVHARAAASDAHALLRLQRLAGNATVARAIADQSASEAPAVQRQQIKAEDEEVRD